MSLEALAADLLERTAASRVTIRRGEGFPVVVEALAEGVPSIRDERTIDLRTQPVALEVAAGRQVVQDDASAAYDDPEFQRMLAAYGGLAAQVVTPVSRGGAVEAILSLHQLGAPRAWTDAEVEDCRRAAAEIARLL